MIAEKTLAPGTRVSVLPDERTGVVVDVHDHTEGPHALVRFDYDLYECHDPCCEPDDLPLSDCVPLDRIVVVPPPDGDAPLSPSSHPAVTHVAKTR